MSRQVSLLFTTVVAALLGTACSKKEEKAAEPAATTEQAQQAAAAPEKKEIKLGQIMPYSGPASAYGTIGKLHTAYFAKINKEGGLNGRLINLISLDDGYAPPKAVEQVRKLVEQENVLAVFNAVGTPSNTAIQKYLNQKKIPHLFAATGATKWNDPKNFPWTIGFNPSYHREGETYAKHILKHNPKAKIAVLYQNDDFGKDVLAGLKAGLGDAAKQIVAESTYEVSDPTIDSQIVTLKASKADVFINVSTPKFAAQAIRKVSDVGWKATQYVANVGSSVGAVLIPAGLERAKGLMTVQYFKDPTDKAWDNDPAMQEYKAFLASNFPEGNIKDGINAYAFITAQTLIQVLKQCGDDLSPANIMAQATALKDFQPGLLYPKVKINTSPTDFEPIDELEIAKFDGEKFVITE
ncbi:MAG: ABC transporter substrate-binding protein [Polyangiales bacterium]